MTQQVIITRAEPGATETAARLAALGYEALKMPALEIREQKTDQQPPAHEIAYIFTSANGVRAVQSANWPLDKQAICVGPATLQAAEGAGFPQCWNADGNADDVFDLIANVFEPATAPEFWHVANEAAAGDLARRLKDIGFRVAFLPLYRTEPVLWSQVKLVWDQIVSPEATLLIHSAKGAASAAAWLENWGGTTDRMKLVGVSERAIAPLQSFSFQKTSYAARPNEAELIETLQTTLNKSVS